MQQIKRPARSAVRKYRRKRPAKWVKAVLFALVCALCFGIVWLLWLQPGVDKPAPGVSVVPSPSPIETPVVTSSPIATPLPTATLSPSAPEPTPALTPTPAPVPQAAACNPGDKGDNVKKVQDMLVSLGFDPGEPDGEYGAQMRAAVRDFQMYANLSADGIAGSDTAAALTQRWQAAQQPASAAQQPLKGCVIGLDPGHQRHGNSDKEPTSPGSDVMKPKVSTGTQGQFTGVPEYVINLQVALKLKAALEALGAQVVMTRETHGVDISNVERAKMMNEANVDCWLRIHANYSPNADNHGMFILVPEKGALDTDDASAVEKSVKLAQALIESTLKTTGADSKRQLEPRDDQTGFGWSKVPVCNIEMGYMSNETEDRLLVTEAYQQKIVDGLTQGFVRYYQS